jgi:hypothetical protein
VLNPQQHTKASAVFVVCFVALTILGVFMKTFYSVVWIRQQLLTQRWQSVK